MLKLICNFIKKSPMKVFVILFSVLVFDGYGQTKASNNPIQTNGNQKDSTYTLSKSDSLEIKADIENYRIQRLIEERKLINPANLLGVSIPIAIRIEFELEVNDQGNVVEVTVISAKDDTNNEIWNSVVLDDKTKQSIIMNIRQQVRYTKLNLGFNTLHSYIVLVSS